MIHQLIMFMVAGDDALWKFCNDFLYGNEGDDNLAGHINDVLDGGAGADEIRGGRL